MGPIDRQNLFRAGTGRLVSVCLLITPQHPLVAVSLLALLPHQSFTDEEPETTPKQGLAVHGEAHTHLEADIHFADETRELRKVL